MILIMEILALEKASNFVLGVGDFREKLKSYMTARRSQLPLFPELGRPSSPGLHIS